MQNDNVALENGFRYKTLNMNPLNIFDMIERGSLTLHPKFRSHSAWSIIQKSRYIESILMGMPAQEIICEENDFGELVVLDGTQRLLSLKEFCSNNFDLKDLKIIKNLNGFKFRELHYNHLSALKDRYGFNFTIISYDTHPLLKFEYYKRINTNSHRFSIQSARNYAYQEAYDLIQSLRQLNDHRLGLDYQSGYTRRDFLWQSKIDQFYLYLICIILIKGGRSHLLETEMSINDLLDDAAKLLNDNYHEWAGIVNYTSDKINSLLSYLDLYDGIDIYSEKDVVLYSNSLGERELLEGENIKISMVKFVHIFILSLDERYFNLNEILNNTHPTPNYFDLNRSCKTILKHI